MGMEEIKSQTSFSYEDLLKIGAGDVFGLDAPKLPLPNMLMCDRITQVSPDGGKYGKGYVEAELDILPDMWFFDCHFRNDPVMPGCLGLDSMWQLTGFFSSLERQTWQRPRPRRQRSRLHWSGLARE